MPSKTAKQARFMAAIAHGWRPPGGGGPPVSVAKEFNQADKGSRKLSSAMRVARHYGKKYAEGGEVDDEGESYTPPPGDLPVNDTPAPPSPRAVDPEALAAFKPLGAINPYEPTIRDRTGRLIAGDNNNPVRQHFAEALVGSRGLGNTGMSLSDLTPAGIAFAGEEAQRDAREGNWVGAGLNATAMIPMAGPAVKAAAPAVKGLAQNVSKELHGIVDIAPQEAATFQKIGGQAGSNPGGFYRDPANGVDYYVKTPPTIDHLRNEVLAAKLYQLAGVPVADPKITVLNGRPAIASPVIHGDPLHDVFSPADYDEVKYSGIKGLHDNFVADAWLGNYDAVGTGKDNVIVDANGQAHRIDMGGALRYRAQGKLKGFGPTVKELKTMKDPNINKDASDVFGHNSFDDEVYRAQQIAKITDDQIRDVVNIYGPTDPTVRGDLTANLRLRRDQIAKDYGVGPQGTPGASGGGQPLTLMQINKTKPTDQIINTLSQKALFHAFDAKAVTGKQQMNIANILDGIPMDELKEAYQNLQDPVKQYNLASWLSNNKLKDLNDALKNSSAKKYAQEPFIENAEELGKHLAPPAEGSSEQIADFLWDKYTGSDPVSIANEIWKLAEKQGVKKANEVFELMPNYKKPEISLALDDIKNEVGYDPWHKQQANDAFDLLEAALKEQAEQENASSHFGGLYQPSISDLDTKSTISDVIHTLKSKFPNDASISYADMQKGKDAINHFYSSALAKNINKLSDIEAAKIKKWLTPEKKADVEKYIDALKDQEWKGHDQQMQAVVEDAFNIATPFDYKHYKLPYEVDPQTLEKIKSLPPEQRAKMEAVGLNTEAPVFHGNANPKYHNILLDPKVFKQNHNEKAFFAAPQYHWASSYAGHSQQHNYIKTFYVKAPVTYELNWKSMFGEGHYSPELMRKVIDEGHKRKADLLILHGLDDIEGHNTTQYAFLQTKYLKAPFAKLAEKYLDKGMPAAGIAGGALFTYNGRNRHKGEEEMNRGGTPRKASGGYSSGMSKEKNSMSQENWMMRAASRNLHHQGMIKSPIPGRTDKIPMSVPAGAYVLPADIPSALGQGNSVAGGKILKNMFSTGPYGISLKINGGGGGRHPSARAISPRQPTGPGGFKAGYFEEGGEVDDEPTEGSHIPIIAAGGEFIIHPEVVKAVGHGDMSKGHKVLDQFVLHTRKEHIKTLQKLKPPKKN